MKITYIILISFLLFGCGDDNICDLKFPDCLPHYENDFMGVYLADSSIFVLNNSDSSYFYNLNYDSIRVSYGIDSKISASQYPFAVSIHILSNDTIPVNIGIFYNPPMGYYNKHLSQTFAIPQKQNFQIKISMKLLQNFSNPTDTQYIYLRDIYFKPNCN